MFLVKVYMKSTNIIEFKTNDLTKTKNGYGQLVGLNMYSVKINGIVN